MDPRADNCRAVRTADGKVVGVELAYRPLPSAKYELVKAELIDEIAAQGQTVASCTVLDANGIPTAERVYLAWAWPELGGGTALPGNPNNEHMISNGYAPPAVGPLALYVGNWDGEPISDIIGGVGLPWNRHVCFRFTWRERELKPQEPPQEPAPNGEMVMLMQRQVGLLEDVLGELVGLREDLAKVFRV